LYRDHQSLSSILTSEVNGSHGRTARWQDSSNEFTLDIHHVPGKDLLIVDGLSRLPAQLMDPPIEVDELVAFAVEAVSLSGSGRYLSSGWYGGITKFKMFGSEDLSLEQKERMNIKRKSRRYVVDGDELYYRENDGQLSVCVLERNVDAVLQSGHDVHGHFSISATLSNLIGRCYWPTRSADVAVYVRSCDACQRVAPLRLSNGLRPIMQFQPMDLVGLDYYGPITPISNSGNRYILVFVDYLSVQSCTRLSCCHVGERS
jgi:hypothetical protein